MHDSAEVIAPNSVLLVGDGQNVQFPSSMGGRLVAATESCVAIGTREEAEGPVRITFKDAGTGADLPPLEVLDHTLLVRSGEVVAATVLGDVVLKRESLPGSVRVVVYVNHSTEPDDIAVVFGTHSHRTDSS